MYFNSCIENGIFASVLSHLNDPYENLGIIHPDDYRVVCLTNSHTAMTMWAHYGCAHKGICLEYEIDDSIQKVIAPVKYQGHHINRRFDSCEEICDHLLIKGTEWSNEKEYRAVYFKDRDEGKRIWKKTTSGDIFLDAKVSKVILGCEVSDDTICGIVKTIQGSKLKIDIERLIPSEERHLLVIDRQFKTSDYL